MSRINLQTLSQAIPYCLGWFPVATFALYLKYYEIARRYSGLLFSSSGIEDHPNLADQLFVYRNDIFFNFFLIPILIILVAYWLLPNRRLLNFLLISSSLVILVLLYANLHSWGTTGRFLTWTSALDAFVFGWRNPSFVDMYIDFDSRVKFAILILSVLVLVLGAKYFSRFKPLTVLINISVGFVFLFAVMTVSLAQTSRMKESPSNNSFLAQAVVSLFGSYWNVQEDEQHHAREDLAKLFATMTKTKPPIKDSPYFGRAKDSDVIVFVLETGSDRFLDLRDDLESFPTLARLSQNSLLALNHYVTFPASAESLFSLFNSVYPPRSFYSTCIVSNPPGTLDPFPGFVSSLKKVGYNTALYLPYIDSVPLDHAFHQNAGFRKIYFAQAEVEKGTNMDKQALRTMKDDVAKWIASDERYVAAFLPQAGHAPWPGRPESRSIVDHGKLVAKWQIEWLAQLVEVVEEGGRLDRTIIVVTGDHGIRTSGEDSKLNAGFLDKYSFRVPLLIFSASAFSEMTQVDSVTSHIDVSPSLLDLLGMKGNEPVAQGMQLWDAGIDERVTFFLANWYFGADGYYDDGVFVMYSEVLDAAFASSELRFPSSTLVKNVDEVIRVRDKTRRLYGIQESWLKQFFCKQEKS